MASFTADQVLDAIYNSNAINGSTVTEYTSDYPHIQVDIITSGIDAIKRLYAWYQYATHTSQGIVYYFGGITAINEVNYKVNTAIVDLLLDNVSGSPVQFKDANFYRDDGAIPCTTTGSVQFNYEIAQIAGGLVGRQILNTKDQSLAIVI
jgi:hypothetical protein